jgi:hypothetical protein
MASDNKLKAPEGQSTKGKRGFVATNTNYRRAGNQIFHDVLIGGGRCQIVVSVYCRYIERNHLSRQGSYGAQCREHFLHGVSSCPWAAECMPCLVFRANTSAEGVRAVFGGGREYKTNHCAQKPKHISSWPSNCPFISNALKQCPHTAYRGPVRIRSGLMRLSAPKGDVPVVLGKALEVCYFLGPLRKACKALSQSRASRIQQRPVRRN